MRIATKKIPVEKTPDPKTPNVFPVPAAVAFAISSRRSQLLAAYAPEEGDAALLVPVLKAMIDEKNALLDRIAQLEADAEDNAAFLTKTRRRAEEVLRELGVLSPER